MNAITDLKSHLKEMLANFVPKSEDEMREWRWENEIVPHLRASQLPERFWFRATKWKPDQKATYDETRELITGTGAIVALVGDRGMGKTTIAAQLMIERAMDETLLPWHRRPPYRKLAKLIAFFKPIFSDFGSRDAETLIRRHESLCKDHPLLVIDELHDCEDQKVKQRLLTDTLDKRYANMVDTIVISNQTPEQFCETTSDSVLSRIKEHGRIIHCTWESWR
ncbi:MAG: IstB-like binding protein [Verrucomicrobiota bacterium]|jgi:DNA replication protein DnaC